jgi:hypothetical protein
MVAKASGAKLFEIAAPLSVIHAPKHIDSGDKPSHDASGPFRAAPIFGIPWLPTPNAIRAVQFIAQIQNLLYTLSFVELRPAITPGQG